MTTSQETSGDKKKWKKHKCSFVVNRIIVNHNIFISSFTLQLTLTLSIMPELCKNLLI